MAAVQHYVPQFLLRNFCGPAGKLWAYDKHTGKSFETNPRNVAGEREFYDIELGEATASMEPNLSKLEGAAGAVVDQIVTGRSLGGLSVDDRVVLAIFVAVQMMRGPNQRAGMLEMNHELRLVLKDRFGIADDDFPELTPDGAKSITMQSMLKPHKFADHIMDKSWLLFETTPQHPLCIGDNPVTMQNDLQPKGPFRGNLGLAVKGIQVYLPITSTLTVAFLCKSHEETIRDGVERMRKSIVNDPGMTMGFGDLLNWRRAFRTGVPLPSKPDNVLNHNSLQVSYAERYVFSSTPNFELVTAMIEENEELRKGPRLGVQ